jgi:hypothetical protein
LWPIEYESVSPVAVAFVRDGGELKLASAAIAKLADAQTIAIDRNLWIRFISGYR